MPTPANSTPPEGSSGPVSALEPGIEAQDVQAPERASGGRTANPPDGRLRDRYAAAIWERQNPGRRYADCEYRWKGDAEADADVVLAVRDDELAALRAQLDEVRRFCELTAESSCRVEAARQARDTLAILNRTHTPEASRG